MQIFASPRIEEVVVHDLRTPLNVISLVLKMVERHPLAQRQELADDLGMIRNSVADLDRMLGCLVQTSRIPKDTSGLSLERFDPKSLINEVLAEHLAKPKATKVELIVADEVPEKVFHDYQVAKLALQLALANSCAASNEKPVSVRLTGEKNRCIWRFEVGVPPRETVQSHDLAANTFERIVGNPGERRGLDLAILAQVTALFGGTARLEAIPGQNSVVILDWPAEISIENS